MSLIKQSVFVPLGVGLRSDVTDKILAPGSGVVQLQNCIQDEVGALIKRHGSTILSNSVNGGGTVPQPWKLATLGGTLCSLAMPGPSPISLWSPTVGKWSGVNTPIPGFAIHSDLRGPVSLSRIPVSRDSLEATSRKTIPDGANGSGYTLVGYELGTSDAITFELLDATTQCKVLTWTVTSARRPRCVVVASQAIGVWIKTDGHLVVDVVDLTNPIAVTETVVNNLPDAASPLEVKNLSAQSLGFSALFKLASGALHETVFATNLAVNEFGVKDSSGTLVSPDLGYCYVDSLADSGTTTHLVSCDSTNGLRAHLVMGNVGGFKTAVVTTTLDAGATSSVSNVSAWTLSASLPGEVFAVYEHAGTIFFGKRLNSGVTSGVAYRGAKLASKAWTYAGDFYSMIVGLDGLQATYSVVRMPFGSVPAPLGRICRQQGTTGTAKANALGQVPAPTATTVLVPVVTTTRIDVAGSSFTLDDGIELVQVTYPDQTVTPTTTPSQEAIGSLFVASGGQLNVFDGKWYGDAGFTCFPSTFGTSPQAGGSMTVSSTYRYVTCYASVDNSGRIWRSGTSLPIDVALGGSDHGVQLTLGTLRLVGRDTTYIEIYRSAANVTAELTLVARVLNNPAADTVLYTDTASDSAIAGAIPLYTTGGILDADVIPGTSIVLSALDRLFIVDNDDPTKLWPSNKFVDGDGLRFSEGNAISIRDGSSAPIVGLAASPNDVLIVFKSDRIYALTGDGADAAGNGGFNVSSVMAGVGAVNSQSIVSFPDGVIFASNKGIQLLDRGLSLSSPIPGTTYVGQPVRAYESEVIVGAVHVPAQAQVRFYTASGTTLVLDYVHWLWSTFTGQPAVTATLWSGLGVYARNSATVYAESASNYGEGGSTYVQSIVTPWLSLAGLEGYERIYQITGAGSTVADHILAVSIQTDYKQSGSPPLGQKAMNAGDGWEWVLRPPKQKLSSMQLQIAETTTSSAAGFKAVGLTVEYGSKRGSRPSPSGNRLAVS